ncbi:MAG: hypothetical protein IKX06_01330 [Clostridia bacterium]|nr:hypothetical protein [Clostridia bacterium]
MRTFLEKTAFLKTAAALAVAAAILLTGILSGCRGGTDLPAAPDPIDDNYRVVYQIFVGSFSDSDGDGTGDLRGIINRMDYLNDGDVNHGNDLGVQLLWLSPIFNSPTYHKYDTVDYYKIDPAFGTEDTLKELIELCHVRNVKIILDVALNHTSTVCAWFQKFLAAHNGGDTEDPYYNWYSWADADGRKGGVRYAKLGKTGEYYECNFDDAMPELNYDVPEVREAMFNVCRYYLELGIDGFRFDAAKYIYYGETDRNVSYWKELLGKLREVKQDVYVVGEVWSGNSEIVTYYDALNCFDFTAATADGMIAAAANGKNGQIDNYTKYIAAFLEQIKTGREDSMYQPFIANHDMDRAAGFMTVTTGAAFMGANLLLLGPGSPVIYYGEEIGMKGSRGAANTDANRRLAMLWGDGDTVKDPLGSTFDSKKQVNGTVSEQIKDKNSLLRYYSKVISIRGKYPAIARGEYSQIDFESNFTGGFDVVYNGEHIGIIHNTGNVETEIDLSQYKGFGFTELLDCVGTGDAKLSGSMLTLGPKTSAILG